MVVAQVLECCLEAAQIAALDCVLRPILLYHIVVSSARQSMDYQEFHLVEWEEVVEAAAALVQYHMVNLVLQLLGMIAQDADHPIAMLLVEVLAMTAAVDLE